MIGFANVYNSNWKKLSKFCSKSTSGSEFLTNTWFTITLYSWSDGSLSHLVVEMEPLNIKSQTLKIFHKKNKLYAKESTLQPLVSYDFSMTSILTRIRKNLSRKISRHFNDVLLLAENLCLSFKFLKFNQ